MIQSESGTVASSSVRSERRLTMPRSRKAAASSASTQSGSTLRNASGDGRLVNFYTQHAWNMALLELFVGGKDAAVTTYAHVPADGPGVMPAGEFPLNDTVTTIEAVVNGTYYALVAAVATDRTHPFRTTVRLDPAARGSERGCA